MTIYPLSTLRKRSSELLNELRYSKFLTEERREKLQNELLDVITKIERLEDIVEKEKEERNIIKPW